MAKHVHLIVTHRDNEQSYFSLGPDEGWRVDSAQRMLIVGQGVPRTMIPLDNVRFFELEKCPDEERLQEFTGFLGDLLGKYAGGPREGTEDTPNPFDNFKVPDAPFAPFSEGGIGAHKPFEEPGDDPAEEFAAEQREARYAEPEDPKL